MSITCFDGRTNYYAGVRRLVKPVGFLSNLTSTSSAWYPLTMAMTWNFEFGRVAGRKPTGPPENAGLL
jgi:hypothetical protein